MSKLSSEKVKEVFLDCLFQENEDKTNFVEVEGITFTAGFHPGRLENHQPEIVEMLDELPESFHEGMSFLAACEDKHGEQWTGLHQIMEQLFLLGIGIGKVVCLLPREAWSVLPGGMPYYKLEK